MKQKVQTSAIVALIGLCCAVIGYAIAYGSETGQMASQLNQHEDRICKLERDVSQMRDCLTEVKTDVKWIRQTMERAH